ncbi:hypothetical protein [Mycolicibacterium chlorophenolicum]|uniref:Uncharacterized protein n=1 Tax=Mycolicibacterium chlorophenolicum TaxID=37916 RepID=A0A0J6VJE7_9MYCO|nr:hypothetical protein [Mycolicibacterium chlorophenolicum]KMO71110.1 hypothetical protein MCHLDSM_04745 [Mycolicibacterium chlorophenolicum]
MSPDLRRICTSGDLLTRTCPASADAVRLLLSVVGHAADLRSVSRLRSVHVQPIDAAVSRIVVEHKEAAMHAVVLTKTGHVHRGDDPGDYWTGMSTQGSLRVDDIRAAGTSLLRLAG